MGSRGAQISTLLVALVAAGLPLTASAELDGGPPPACLHPADAGCLALAAQLLVGTNGPRDPARAANLYSRACDAGNGEACLRLAGLFESGTGTLTSFGQALAFLRKGCDLRNAEACTRAGALIVEGVGARDAAPGDASKLFEQACALGSGLGCLRVAGAAELGGAAARGRAAAFYQRACEAGEPAGCSNFLALALSITGPVRAGSLLQEELTACDREDSLACWFVGDLYRDGLGIPRSLTNAASFYQRACAAEEPLACTSLGEMYLAGQGVAKDGRRAAALFRTACQEGDDDACSRVPTRRRKGR